MIAGVLVAAAAMNLAPPVRDIPRPMPGPPQIWVAPGVADYSPRPCECGQRPSGIVAPQGPVVDGMRETLADVRRAAATLVLVAGDLRSGVAWSLGLLRDFLAWLWVNYPAIRAGAVKAGAAVDDLGWATVAKLGGAFLLLSLLSAAIQAGATRIASKRT